MVYLFVSEISLPKEISTFCELEIDLTVELIADMNLDENLN